MALRQILKNRASGNESLDLQDVVKCKITNH